MSETSFKRPFPALTPSQRYYLDVYGYVVIPEMLTRDECARLIDAGERLKASLEAVPQVKNGITIRHMGNFWIMFPIVGADPTLTAYTTHPRLVGIAEELIGGEARIVEAAFSSNVRDPASADDTAPRLPFHTGMDVPFGSHIQNGLYHCCFVKTLTNLTDLGPDDGGTAVIVGSHKMNVPISDIINAAYEDRSLIHQVVAPAGSTLLFSETLVHATGQLRSDRRRYIIICGYASRLFPYWGGGEMSEEFKEQIPEHLDILFNGRAHWTRGPKYRTLDEPAEAGTYELGHWADR
jgi:hypothetical protein